MHLNFSLRVNICRYTLSIMEFLKSVSNFRYVIARVGLKQFLLMSNIMPQRIQCIYCGANSAIINKHNRQNKLFYRCGSSTCRRRSSLAGNIFFHTVQIPINKYLEIIIIWFLRYPPNVIVRESKLSRNTVYKCLKHIRNLISAYMHETSVPIGGPGRTVEIDESVFGKRKYNRGRVTNTKWVVGGICRETKTCFL